VTTTAFLFPGQGSQKPGMGEVFYDAWPEVRARFDALSDALGEDLADLCFEADAATLQRTRNTQPALFGLGAAVSDAVVERWDVSPDYVAGHSLGHFTALSAASALDPSEGIGLVRRRGELLAEAGERAGPGTMLAVLLVDPDTVAAACEGRDDVGVGLYNGPRQTVVSGTEAGVAAVREELAEESRARFRELDVSAAFHSPVMASALPAVEREMDAVDLDPAEVPVVSDASCRCYTSPSVAHEDLAAQVTAAVDWHGVVEVLADRGVDRYVVSPPGGTLAGFVERIHPEAETVVLDAPADAARL